MLCNLLFLLLTITLLFDLTLALSIHHDEVTPPKFHHLDLQSDLIHHYPADPNKPVRIPDLNTIKKRHPHGEFLSGKLVQRTLSSRELKSIRHVEQADGKVVAGPFPYWKAVRVAGKSLIKDIFPYRVAERFRD